jgi:hypothetical protein
LVCVIVTTELPEISYGNAFKLSITPNPVNITSTIRYWVPFNGKYSLEVYDIAGKKRLAKTITA